MPKEMENKLKAGALKRFGNTSSERARAYIYGTMRDTGWKPRKERMLEAMKNRVKKQNHGNA